MNKNAKGYIFTGLGLCAVLIVLGGYYSGYRLTDSLRIGRVGRMEIDVPLIQTAVYVDNALVASTTKDNDLVSTTLSPSTHNIIVSHVGYFPWQKTIVVPSNGTVRLKPIYISQNPSGVIITKNDPEYWTLFDKIVSSQLPTESSPVFSTGSTTKLWVDNNAIIVQDMTLSSTSKEFGPHVVIQPDTVVKNVSFYKDSSDAVIFSTNNGVYFIDTDTSTKQNFMPIYTGQDPEFMPSQFNFIYVRDNDTLMQVVI